MSKRQRDVIVKTLKAMAVLWTAALIMVLIHDSTSWGHPVGASYNSKLHDPVQLLWHWQGLDHFAVFVVLLIPAAVTLGFGRFLQAGGEEGR